MHRSSATTPRRLIAYCATKMKSCLNKLLHSRRKNRFGESRRDSQDIGGIETLNATELAVNLIALHGSQVVGRTRLQKRTYLLHRCGGDFGLNFVYHHYGPYSFDLADGLTDARAEGLIEIKEMPGRYGVPYETFRLKESSGEPERIGSLAIKDALRLRGILDNEASDIVLEIAATIVFLRDEGRLQRAGNRRDQGSEAAKGDRATAESSTIIDLRTRPQQSVG